MPQYQKTPKSQSIPDKPDSPALTRLSLQLSTQNAMSGVTALWHLERKLQKVKSPCKFLGASRAFSPVIARAYVFF